jgi:hypothetical protein
MEGRPGKEFPGLPSFFPSFSGVIVEKLVWFEAWPVSRRSSMTSGD